MQDYAQQNRGDADAYSRYLANMDAAMRHKVALVAAHLPDSGHIADMGMGSGSGSEALAALYPGLQVTGIDVNPTMVELAGTTYRLPNLAFRVGDIAEPCFPDASLSGVINSSVLHHVTSYNSYDYRQAGQALAAQAQQLADHGTLIVRDFLAPKPAWVRLHLPDQWLDWFQRFCREFRGLQPAEQRGVEARALGKDERGWNVFELEHRYALEFVLRKDYQQDWASEILEEYCYFTQAEFEAEFQQLGLRVLVSTPLHNPWIQRRRFFGQFHIQPDWPATNYLIVGEKVPAGEGVAFRCAEMTEPEGFLDMVCYRHRETGQVFDLVRRPHPTVDVMPYLVTQNNLTVIVRSSYPRPILTRMKEGLDGLSGCGYTVEPITALQGELPLGETVEELLQNRAGIAPEAILSMRMGDIHYPSPGGIREQVQACFVEVENGSPPEHLDNPLPWSHHGRIRALDAHQLLRSAQVHGLSDHRLEMHIFALMRKLAIDPGVWLGDKLENSEDPTPVPAASLWPTPRRMFVLADPLDSPGFLQIQRHRYEELAASGEVIATGYLESVVARDRSLLTLVALPMSYAEGAWWVGLALDELPAAQAFSGNSQHWIAPAWRLPEGVQGVQTAQSWCAQHFHREFGVQPRDWAALGGPYFPSPGLTPELVYPYAVRVDGSQPSNLHFFRLEEIMEQWESFSNGHLRCLLLRAYLAHRLETAV